MDRTFPEADWKVYAELHPTVLERFCDQVLADIRSVLDDTRNSNHKRCIEVFRLARERKKEMASLFDDYRRSTAFLQLALMQSYDLLTPEDLAAFSAETREKLQRIRRIPED
jgi:hypothetical protein